jgi:hypothetical protein
MTDYSELIERLEGMDTYGYQSQLACKAATAIRDLIAERDAAQATGWNQAIEELESADGFGEWRGAAEYLRAMSKDTPQ